MLPNISFTIINLIGICFTILISSIVFVILINHLRRHQNVTLLLLANTYAAMFTFSIVLLVTHIDILIADIYGFSHSHFRQSTLCRLQGYLTYGTYGCCYMTFVLQAFYRLTRVAYFKYKFLKVCKFQPFILMHSLKHA